MDAITYVQVYFVNADICVIFRNVALCVALQLIYKSNI